MQALASFPGSSPAFCCILYIATMADITAATGAAITTDDVHAADGITPTASFLLHTVQYATKSWGGAREQGYMYVSRRLIYMTTSFIAAKCRSCALHLYIEWHEIQGH